MCGKSIFLSIFSKYIEKQNKSILILDTCEENNSISVIFGKAIKENIQKISENISYIFYSELENKNDYINLKKIIEKNKIEFDYILIDANFNLKSELYKNITIISDDILFLIEPNLIELKKAKRILEVYEYDFEIPHEKIKIIFNKSNQFRISSEILAEVFSEYKILEYINYHPDYTLYIHKNTKHLIKEEPYKKIYAKLLNQIKIDSERSFYGINNR